MAVPQRQCVCPSLGHLVAEAGCEEGLDLHPGAAPVGPTAGHSREPGPSAPMRLCSVRSPALTLSTGCLMQTHHLSH